MEMDADVGDAEFFFVDRCFGVGIGSGQIAAQLAVLGPARMEYAKIIGLLDFMKQHMTQMLSHYQDET